MAKGIVYGVGIINRKEADHSLHNSARRLHKNHHNKIIDKKMYKEILGGKFMFT